MKHLALGACALVLAGACGPSPDSNEDAVHGREDAFRTFWFGVDHNDLTEAGLHFLSSDIADQIGDFNEEVDSGWTQPMSEYHVDNCRIQESFDQVRVRHEGLVQLLNPANLQGLVALKEFGILTHTLQDFYAHSNWVEGGQTGILSPNTFQFPPTGTGKMVGGMIVTTESLPFTYTIDLEPGSRVPIVTWAGTTTFSGLITGTYDNVDPSICPIEASIAHGGHTSQGAYGTFLAKDDPDSPHHAAAKALAIRQTTEEFCRVARRVLLRYGNPGLDALLKRFEANRAGYLAACPRDRGMVAGVFTSVI